MSKWLDDMHRNSQKITTIAYALESYGNSFSHIGNEIMAGEMYHFSDLLLEIAKSNRQVSADIVNRELKETQAMTASILNAALAGDFVERNTKDK